LPPEPPLLEELLLLLLLLLEELLLLEVVSLDGSAVGAEHRSSATWVQTCCSDWDTRRLAA
jgi:hypothetical protein